jgi:succinoglycan biosynthesis protein ExoM
LRRLLHKLGHQETNGAFTYSIVVADNDAELSGKEVVDYFAAHSRVGIVYCSEPRRNIALARNCAAENARGEYIAWIDDDEFPAPGWLKSLVAIAQSSNAAAVLGPVRPYFETPPPRWLIEGHFCERPEYATGTVMNWSRCFAGNALVRQDIMVGLTSPFRAEFGLGGEDVDFFRRMAGRGHFFVWCAEAEVHEFVPPCRWTRTYRWKRALVHGSNSVQLCNSRAVAKSLLAIPVYSLCLPIAFVLGHHVFMRLTEKTCGHLGRVLSYLGLHPVHERPA